jgi:hypothetical protein
VNGRLATVNMPILKTDSRPVNEPLTIGLVKLQLRPCSGPNSKRLAQKQKGEAYALPSSPSLLDVLDAFVLHQLVQPFPIGQAVLLAPSHEPVSDR